MNAAEDDEFVSAIDEPAELCGLKKNNTKSNYKIPFSVIFFYIKFFTVQAAGRNNFKHSQKSAVSFEKMKKKNFKSF